MYTERFTETHALLATHYPLTRQVATHVSDWVLMANYHRAFFEVLVGAMGAAATLDADLQQASDATGTGVKAISGKSITQLTQAGTDDNSPVGIELRTEELDVNGGFEYVRFRVIIGVADCAYSATLRGCCPRYAPVSTTVYDEVVD
jgi:hypothetical protein